MRIKTRYFGEIDLEEEKVITFEQGILGFEQYKQYTILYDIEQGEKQFASWLQSLDEPQLALPIINPYDVKEDYNPIIEDEMLKELGEIKDETIILYTTLTVPKDTTEMTTNLKAPIIINSHTKKGCQLIVDNIDYEIKYKIYDIIHKVKNKEEEE